MFESTILIYQNYIFRLWCSKKRTVKAYSIKNEEYKSRSRSSKPGSPSDSNHKNSICTTPDDNPTQNNMKTKSSSSRLDRNQENYSDDNDDDDEVNDLFKQIRKMSNRSSSRSSNNTSFKGSKEKSKSSNPFLEPFHRHSSVDMKGKKEIHWQKSDYSLKYLFNIKCLFRNKAIIHIFPYRCYGAK